jgi:hypothetical protein
MGDIAASRREQMSRRSPARARFWTYNVLRAMAEQTTATVTVHRTAPEDMQERELYVSLDGGPNTILSYGDSVTMSVEAGRHRLRVHNTISRRRVEFDVAAGDQIRFSAANVRGRNFGILATFLGIGPMHTVLDREA